MENLEIDKRVKYKIIEVLEIENFSIENRMNAADIPGWDSLTHLNIVVALEVEFSIELNPVEVKKCNNIGELIEVIKSKIRLSKGIT